ncbi:alpha-ketoglutarate-dependent 2,4-dichlorophenoxyacetate dioxygenase [Paraburkholderia xenovorans LB400]|jgi:alpha-ketoglutarate-dependent 2,4-dichlorophenoxyacetate dioxygenase|uniref:Alpha KG dependent 2,4-D dioxygenase n=1 Tax=Paraburkholderia xenovorans (strain LB400) TaxID=266265 RepID=Q13PZ4_PARXL|nr:TauD/TfdA family dioxygenase [Paraburkholderia xenovorans]ABE33845.1 Putative alpha KG dependent 2,4-D dioxygenase [Paraburkholderia xenovorans LB400]AIP36268.1 alpha-ketoglutarate-dependent 2,4-dichlorophenoxyacetate dioxygenase [Paraburkholderia xenovorans LB400]NPT38723.1 TauD/TfdA family dioxygenase [Paraburkholderia xenovorans]
MSLDIEPAHPTIAARIRGLDLRQPLSDEQVDEIGQASAIYPVLIFPNQLIDDAQLMAFSQNFGPLQPVVSFHTAKADHRLSPMVSDISNLDKNNRTFPAGDRRRMNFLSSRRWHTDGSYLPTPNRYSMLLAYTVARVGGQTQFADMRAAYDALPAEWLELVEDLTLEHNVMHSRAVAGFTDFDEEERRRFPATHKKLVRRHPVSGRLSLYLSGHASHVVGWPVPEGLDLLRELTEFATQPQFVYTHEWSVRDLVMWDNRSLMHRARRHFPDTDVREMHRASTIDDLTWVRPKTIALAG